MKPENPAGPRILERLGIHPSPECLDYVRNRTSFQLHNLITEKPHPKTKNLSRNAEKDTESCLRMLFDADEDIVRRLEEWAQHPALLDQAAKSVKTALLQGKKIFIYGCGATGRLAKQMESTFWRPFWKQVQSRENIQKIIQKWPGNAPEDRLIGEMTGGDRALISSLEGFEDLLLMGRLQLEDRGIRKGDLVICVTEGGETSSVIGTVLAARNLWKKDVSGADSRNFLYFVYNNPDSLLMPFDRSRKVLEDPGITKINLTTGPQALAGSTRMQAATIETYVIGHILQSGAEQALREFLSPSEMKEIGFPRGHTIPERLREFKKLQAGLRRAAPSLARLSRKEADVYASGGRSTYFAEQALITVFIDSTERSPTFRLFPLDTVLQKNRSCWIQVWTSALDSEEAWNSFLGRPFRGLRSRFYRKPLSEKIADPYLRKTALSSLEQAGEDQQRLYDFSLSDFNLKYRTPKPGDFGLAVAVDAELPYFQENESFFRFFLSILEEAEIPGNLLIASENREAAWEKTMNEIPAWEKGRDTAVMIPVASEADPMGINRHCALKMALNAHSTTVMARLGKAAGNRMVYVQPANLKLIGRAVFLVQSLVNEVLRNPRWEKKYGKFSPVTYMEAGAVLFEAMDFMKARVYSGQPAEVPLSVIRILEAFRLSGPVSQETALNKVENTGLNVYLENVTK